MGQAGQFVRARRAQSLGPVARSLGPVGEPTGLELPPVRTGRPGIPAGWTPPDPRRCLQLMLASIWLLDGLLQMQAFFFTRAFGTRVISMTAAGNPSPIARAILWSGHTIGHHPVLINASFALVQVAIGVGMALRRTAKAALGASIAWSLAVWCLGEGFGGVFAGTANPVTGAPGAVLIYAVIAVLVWPSDRPGPRPAFPAGRAVGVPMAKAVWLVLWGSLSYFALVGANRSPRGLHALILGQAVGEPAWVAWVDRHSADGVDHRGLVVATILSVLLALTAVGIYLPGRRANAAVVVAMALAVAFWVVGQDFGALFSNGATDVNSGPLLVLLGLAFWRRHAPGGSPPPPPARAPGGV